jgi:hypothetical protein
MSIWPFRHVESLVQYLLVEDRNTAQGTAAPLSMITVESRIHRVEEWADEGKFHSRALNGAFPDDVGDCLGALVSNAPWVTW